MVRHVKSLLLAVLFLASLLGACSRAPQAAGPATPRATATAPAAVTPPTATPVPEHLTAQPAWGDNAEEYPLEAPLVVVFNQPMQTDLSEPLRITPRTAGRLIWSENRTKLTFEPTAGFAPNTTYRIRLDPALQQRFRARACPTARCGV